MKEDSPEIQAIDPPEDQKAEEPLEEKPEDKPDDKPDAEQTEQETETDGQNDASAQVSKQPDSEEAKQANKDLEHEEAVLEHGNVYFFYKPKVLSSEASETSYMLTRLKGRCGDAYFY